MLGCVARARTKVQVLTGVTSVRPQFLPRLTIAVQLSTLASLTALPVSMWSVVVGVCEFLASQLGC